MFINSSVFCGNLGCYYFLVIVDTAAVNIHAQVFALTYFHYTWVYILGLELLGHMVTLCLTFIWKLPDCFSNCLYYFAFPQVVYEGSNLSTSFVVNICCFVFYHSHRSVKQYLIWFWFAFPSGYWCSKYFHMLISHLHTIFRETFIQILSHVLIGLSFYFFIVEL